MRLNELASPICILSRNLYPDFKRSQAGFRGLLRALQETTNPFRVKRILDDFGLNGIRQTVHGHGLGNIH
jgi:hypothetical protein